MGEVLLYFRKICLVDLKLNLQVVLVPRPVQNSNKQNRADTLFEFVTDNETFRILGQHTIGKNLLRNIKKTEELCSNSTYIFSLNTTEWMENEGFQFIVKIACYSIARSLFKTSQHYIQSFLPFFFFCVKHIPLHLVPEKIKILMF